MTDFFVRHKGRVESLEGLASLNELSAIDETKATSDGILGRLAAKVVHMPWATFCSELVATTEQTVSPRFMDGLTQVSPQDIDDWCRAHGWESETMKAEDFPGN